MAIPNIPNVPNSLYKRAFAERKKSLLGRPNRPKASAQVSLSPLRSIRLI